MKCIMDDFNFMMCNIYKLLTGVEFDSNNIQAIHSVIFLNNNTRASFDYEEEVIYINPEVFSKAMIEICEAFKECTVEEFKVKQSELLHNLTPDLLEYFISTFHELRHHYQYTKHKDFFINSREKLNDNPSKEDIEKYQDNILEIDAFAFSYFVVFDKFLENKTQYNYLYESLLNSNQSREKIEEVIQRFKKKKYDFNFQ